jgi:putative endonuclease
MKLRTGGTAYGDERLDPCGRIRRFLFPPPLHIHPGSRAAINQMGHYRTVGLALLDRRSFIIQCGLTCHLDPDQRAPGPVRFFVAGGWGSLYGSVGWSRCVAISARQGGRASDRQDLVRWHHGRGARLCGDRRGAGSICHRKLDRVAQIRSAGFGRLHIRPVGPRFHQNPSWTELSEEPPVDRVSKKATGIPEGAYLFIVGCRDGSLYVGTTRSSLETRIARHNAGAFKGYTESRRPVELVFSEWFDRITDAIESERKLKG